MAQFVLRLSLLGLGLNSADGALNKAALQMIAYFIVEYLSVYSIHTLQLTILGDIYLVGQFMDHGESCPSP